MAFYCHRTNNKPKHNQRPCSILTKANSTRPHTEEKTKTKTPTHTENPTKPIRSEPINSKRLIKIYQQQTTPIPTSIYPPPQKKTIQRACSLREGGMGEGRRRSQSFAKPMTVVRSTTLSDLSRTSRQAAERDWKILVQFVAIPRAVMSRSSLRHITSVWRPPRSEGGRKGGIGQSFPTHAHFITIVGVGKKRRILIGPW